MDSRSGFSKPTILTKRTNSLNMEDCVKEGRMYRIEYLEDDKEWVVTSEEYPGLSWIAASPLEALKGYMKMVEELDTCDEGKTV